MPEERRVVETTETTETGYVEREPVDRVVEHRPARRTVVHDDDPVANAYAASTLIQTIVWSIVVLVLLIVALWALHVYAGLF